VTLPPAARPPLLCAGGAALGCVRVASHASDQGDDGLATGDPEWSAELGRESPRFLAGGKSDVPFAEERGDHAVEHEHPGQLAEPALGARAGGGGRQKVHGDVEGTEDERGGPEVARGLGI